VYFGVLKVCRKLTAYALLLGLLAGGFILISNPVKAAPGINKQINFQGRLLNSQGATVPDGYYNIEFKIYQDGDGLTVASTGTPAGTPEWTEDWLNNNGDGVMVKNGFMSVELGSVTAFGTSIDWNQDTLYLSMNIAGINPTCATFAACTPDGEMLPMKRLSSTPYSLNSGLLGGLSSAQFLQLAQGVQTDASTNTSSIYVNKTGTGNLVTLQSGSNDSFVINNTGDINFGANANHTVSVTTAAASTAGKSLTITGGAAGTGATALAGGDLVLQGGAAGGTNSDGGNVTIDAGLKNGSGADGTISIGNSLASTIQIGNATLATGTQTINVGNANTAGGTTNVTVGNGGTATGGTTTIQAKGNVMISTNGITRATFDTTNDLYLGNGTIAAAPNDFTIIGTASSTTAVAGGSINVQGGNATVGDANGGNVAINSGTLFGSGTDGTVSIGNTHASTVQIGNPTLAVGTQTINVGNGDTAGGTTNVTVGAGSTAAGGITTVRSKDDLTVTTSNGNMGLTAGAGTMTVSSSGNSSLTSTGGTIALSSNGNTTITSTAGTVGIVSNGATTITTNGAVRGTFDSASYGLYLGAGVTGALNPFTVSATNGSAGVAGSALTVKGGIGGSSSAGGALNLQGGAGGTTSGAGGAVGVQGGNATAGNSNGGDLSLNAGTKFGAGVDGNINIGNLNTNTIQVGNTALAAGTQTINIGNNNTAGGTTNVTIGSGNTATTGTTALQAKGNITISTAGVARGTFDSATGNLYLGNGVTAGAPSNFTISGTGSSTTAVAGGTITVQGGNATVGNANGGNLTLSGGTGFGTGSNGLVVMSTPTFSTTANDANCYTGGALVAATCTFTNASVNNSAAILAGFSATGQTANLPDPTISTAGRVIYITAANSSKDFILSVNGGGVGDTIAMRQNTTATMIWNGSDWTAAGASSSTTLQSAYDNTLTTAGGAELVLSNSANANGLTIRDNPTTPINGALLEVQTSTAGQLFSINNNTTEYAKDGGAETGGGTSDTTDATFPATTWSQTATGSTVSRTTTTINANAQISTGMASVSVVTTGTANAGAINRLSTTLTQNMRYNVSFTSKLLSTSNAFQDLAVYYSVNGSTLTTQCVNYSTQTIQVSAWSKINCTVSIPAGATSTNSIIIVQTGATAHTFYIDNLSVSLSADVNYATDGGADDTANFATNWTAVGSASVAADASVGNERNTSARVTAGTAAGNGIRNILSINPFTGSTLYRVTVYAYISAGTTPFNDFTIRYSPNAGTNFISCKDYNTQIVSTSPGDFAKITCYITTDNTAITTPYVYFTQTAAAGSARTWYVDTFSMNLSSNTVPNVQIGGGLAGSPLTLFTLDRGASAPIAANNDALLGSMYYDTTLGKLQCYESDGWGACGSSPDNVITISPEYTNAVLHGTGVGTMTSDLCSDTLDINDGSSSQATICGTNETYNFYKWTSPQASAQTYSIYVTYQLPSTFKSFTSGQTSLMGRTDNGPSSGTGTVQYSIFRNSTGSVLTQCGSAITVSTGTSTAWEIGTTTGENGAADPSACGFNAGDSIVFKIDMIANQNANAYVGNLNFTFTNK